MAQSDQIVQNAGFPTVRADINDNLAALFSQSSGPSAPATTVAFQPWVDTSSTPPVWKVRNANNNGWITVGVLDSTGFTTGGITQIANGGTGATTAIAALTALLPSQTGNAGKSLQTNGTNALWAAATAGASIQIFTSSGTYTPASGKTSFLVFATGGGGGGAGSSGSTYYGGGGGAGGTGLRLYSSTELGASATVTVGAAGAAGAASSGAGGNGGNSSITPSGTGLVLTAGGGAGGSSSFASLPGSGASVYSNGGLGGTITNAQVSAIGQFGMNGGYTIRRDQIGTTNPAGGGAGGWSFWGQGPGAGGPGANWNSGTAGNAGIVVILEW